MIRNFTIRASPRGSSEPAAVTGRQVDAHYAYEFVTHNEGEVASAAKSMLSIFGEHTCALALVYYAVTL